MESFLSFMSSKGELDAPLESHQEFWKVANSQVFLEEAPFLRISFGEILQQQLGDWNQLQCFEHLIGLI